MKRAMTLIAILLVVSFAFYGTALAKTFDVELSKVNADGSFTATRTNPDTGVSEELTFSAGIGAVSSLLKKGDKIMVEATEDPITGKRTAGSIKAASAATTVLTTAAAPAAAAKPAMPSVTTTTTTAPAAPKVTTIPPTAAKSATATAK